MASNIGIAEALKRDYNIGSVVQLKDISSSTACYLIDTAGASYVFKHVGRRDFVQIHDKIWGTLSKEGLTHGRVMRTNSGELMSQLGYTLFEFIPGETHPRLDDNQFRTAIEYLYVYNQALRKVPFAPEEIWQLNNWDRVKSVQFLYDNIEPLITHVQMDDQACQLLRQARNILKESMTFFQNNSKQLLHSDLGPDNIVFYGNEIRAIIDFTPEYENEIYSVAQFLYWNCLWDYQKSDSLPRIGSTLGYYFGAKEQAGHKEALFLYLVKACLFRIMGPALNMVYSDSFDQNRIQHRLQVLQTLLDMPVTDGQHHLPISQ